MNLCFWGIDFASVSAIFLLDFAIDCSYGVAFHCFKFFIFLFIPAFDSKREITAVIYGNHSLSIPIYVRCISVLVINCANFCQPFRI